MRTKRMWNGKKCIILKCIITIFSYVCIYTCILWCMVHHGAWTFKCIQLRIYAERAYSGWKRWGFFLSFSLSWATLKSVVRLCFTSVCLSLISLWHELQPHSLMIQTFSRFFIDGIFMMMSWCSILCFSRPIIFFNINILYAPLPLPPHRFLSSVPYIDD